MYYCITYYCCREACIKVGGVREIDVTAAEKSLVPAFVLDFVVNKEVMKYTFLVRSLWRCTSSIARRMWPYSKRTGGMDYADDEVSGRSTESSRRECDDVQKSD